MALDQILQIASKSTLVKYHWKDRGLAPAGYIKGMAVVYANIYCKWKDGADSTIEMAKAITDDESKDALAWYIDLFQKTQMKNGGAGVDNLRHLFVLLTGLGMRESSGRYCEGRDRSAENISAETAEAGLFQTSYDARTSSPMMPKLITQYANSTKFSEIFKDGVTSTSLDRENFGIGLGVDFQELSKTCPLFAAEFAAIGLRNNRKHWGPINTREAEVLPECDEMFLSIQKIVDSNDLCSQFKLV